MTIIVCPLADVPEVCLAHRPSHLLTLLSPGGEPPEVVGDHAPARRLFLPVNDIGEAREALTAPDQAIVEQILAFSADWTREQPFLVHCWAGISRSTAAAFAVACQHRPDAPEAAVAQALRRASPLATPNRLIVAFADQALGRQGRMIAAAEAIGRGQEAMMGRPFELALSGL
jgi:predicted protein tyrosine phosphatase